MSIKGFEVGGVQAKYDYESLDNIPANLVQDANYVHTDNNYTNADKTKLSGIEAQANKTTIDATLTHSGQAADAKATGDAISALNAQVIASMPHDTASGSIASFPDGAAMPVIDCSVAVAPNQDLHGYDNPWPAGGGKNKWIPTETTTIGSLTFTTNADGSVTVNGSTSSYTSVQTTGTLAAGTYTLRNGLSSNQGVALAVFVGSSAVAAINYGSQNFTLSEETEVKYRIYVNNTTVNNVKVYPMVCLSSESADYSPYSNICPISGWTEATVTRTGKNINPYEGVDFTADTHPAGFWLNAGDYVFSLDTGGAFGTGNSIYIKLKDRDGNVITDGNISGDGWSLNSTRNYYYGFGGNYTSAPFTLLTDCFFCFGFNNTKPTANGVQLELGSTATAYEPYQGQTYTIDLDGTRYGGTLDVVAGKFTATHIYLTPAKSTFKRNNDYQFYFNPNTQIAIGEDTICLCNRLRSWDGTESLYKHEYYCFVNSGGAIRVNTADAFSTANDAYDAIGEMSFVCQLATPIEVDLDPVTIETLLGTNNIFADCGDTTVNYYADPTLFVNKKIAAAVAALS